MHFYVYIFAVLSFSLDRFPCIGKYIAKHLSNMKQLKNFCHYNLFNYFCTPKEIYVFVTAHNKHCIILPYKQTNYEKTFNSIKSNADSNDFSSRCDVHQWLR